MLFFDASPVVGDMRYWYIVRRCYCVVLWFETITLYNITEGVAFADMSDYPNNNIIFFVCMDVTSLF